jgi:D-3-phosphoglycerate dehydrogenase / 2-oxoglutarate reductase
MTRIFLTHESEARRNYYGARALAGLRALGEVVLNDGNAVLSTPDLITAAKDCAIIVSDRSTPGEAMLFAALPDLVSFHRCAVDIRTIDVAAASKHGVLVTNASPGFIDAVAELVLGFLVDRARHISDYAAAYHRGQQPKAIPGHQLAGATLGIIGYGAIGQRLAELGLALGMTVLVEDPYKKVTGAGLEQVSLSDLMARADFVVCLAVATAETENLIDASALASMKSDAVFINVSRGNLVDEKALEVALKDGRLAGAALDVGRSPDQMPSPDLAALPNVVATPHVGGLTPEAIEAQALETVEQVKAVLSGRIPHNAINAEAATRLERFGIEPVTARAHAASKVR